MSGVDEVGPVTPSLPRPAPVMSDVLRNHLDERVAAFAAAPVSSALVGRDERDDPVVGNGIGTGVPEEKLPVGAPHF